MAWRYGIYKSRGSLANRKFSTALSNNEPPSKIKTGIICFGMELVADDCVKSLEKQSAHCKEQYKFFKQQSTLNLQSKKKKERELGKRQHNYAKNYLRAFKIFFKRLKAIQMAQRP